MDLNLVEIFVKKISYSQSQNEGFVLIMEETETNLNLPIVIGAFEAQAIAIELERNKIPPRPLTHDLFKSLAESFDIKILQVMIYKLENGIFYSNILCERDGQKSIIEARTSDAIAIALRFKAPIYILLSILKDVGIYFPQSDNDVLRSAMDSIHEVDQKENQSYTNRFSKHSLKELERMLEDCIESEDYEMAALIRDEISRREK